MLFLQNIQSAPNDSEISPQNCVMDCDITPRNSTDFNHLARIVTKHAKCWKPRKINVLSGTQQHPDAAYFDFC